MAIGVMALNEHEKAFFVKVAFGQGPDACWTWMGSYHQEGYGVFRAELAHRVSYAMKYVLHPFQALHHVCENRACVNPAHLEQMSRAEHVKRHPNSLETVYMQRRTQEYCKYGHSLEDAYLRSDRYGRECRECRRERSRRGS